MLDVRNSKYSFVIRLLIWLFCRCLPNLSSFVVCVCFFTVLMCLCQYVV